MDLFLGESKKTIALRFVISALIALGIIFFLNSRVDKNLSTFPLTTNIGTSTPTTTEDTSDGLPRLIIPSIGVDAHVQSVGITLKGNMGVPTNYTDVGWYKFGTKPGDKGNAVIDGHVDNGWGIAAVFKNLNKLKIGDMIYVVDNKGATSTFKVIKTAEYPYDNAPISSIFGQTNDENLNLITCAGTWLESAKTDDKRLVVFTQKVI